LKSGNIKVSEVDSDVLNNFKNTYVGFMEFVLGLEEEKELKDELLNDTIQLLIDLRRKARVDKNFSMSDKIRDDLKKIGIQIKDGKDGEITYSIE